MKNKILSALYVCAFVAVPVSACVIVEGGGIVSCVVCAISALYVGAFYYANCIAK